MNNVVILSSQNTKILEKESENYDISQIGSLSVSNGQYFLTFLGKLKETVVEKEPEAPVKPKVASKPSVNKTK